jgi:hypothetical protein
MVALILVMSPLPMSPLHFHNTVTYSSRSSFQPYITFEKWPSLSVVMCSNVNDQPVLVAHCSEGLDWFY